MNRSDCCGAARWKFSDAIQSVRVLVASCAASLCLLALLSIAAPPAQGQTYSTLYSFAGIPRDGDGPESGVVIDGAGNLFGTTVSGGTVNGAAGAIYELPCLSYDASTHSCTKYSSTDKVLYTPTGNSKGSSGDGSGPEANLIIDGAGNLFGTTTEGGLEFLPGCANGCGTIFELPCTSYNSSTHSCTTYSSTDTVLHSFGATASDGAYPDYSPVVMDAAGNLFGTTYSAGAPTVTGASPTGTGTVYELACSSYNATTHSCTSYSSSDTVLYTFPLPGDGPAEYPEGGVILDGAGNLFGPTTAGGTNGGGTIFELACKTYDATTQSCTSYNSTITVLYNFGQNFTGDASDPYFGLILDGAGNLFGTTYEGGAHFDGAVYELACATYKASAHSCTSYSSTDTVLYSFGSASGDGTDPMAGVTLDGAGNLFGTTNEGGSTGYAGAVFELPCNSYNPSTQSCATYSSTDMVLHSFSSSDDGNNPVAGLALDGSGNLFGTANAGGTILGVVDGTIFEEAGAAVGIGSGAPQTITFPKSGPYTYGTSTFPLTATASSGLAVSYTPNTPAVCSVSGSVATILNAGSCSITATQLGNSTYAAATPVEDTFSVNPAPLTAACGNAEAAQGAGIVLPAATLTGVVNGDAIMASCSTKATTSSLAGAYPITPVFSDPQDRLPDYEVTLISGTLFIYSTSGTAPLIFWLSADSANEGASGFTLSVYGVNFNSKAMVLWNGAVRATTDVSSTELQSTIIASDIAKEGTYLVTVANPAPNAATSAAQPFVAMSSTPVPTITGASISDAADGSGNHVLSLRGADFVSGSTIERKGAGLVTTYLSPWQIMATLPVADFGSAAEVIVVNPAPGGTSAGFELP